MAYSKNVRRLVIGLCKGRSAEEASNFLSEQNYDEIMELAGTLSVQLNRLDYQEIEKIKIDPKTIRTWLSDKSLQDRFQSIGHFDMEKHRHDLLIPVISQLRDISVFPARDLDLAIFWSRPSEPSWPLGSGNLERQTSGRLGIRLFIEDKLEWAYLRQHLIDDPIWDAIDKWKQAMVMDLTARFKLLDKIVAEIQSKIGLPVLEDLGYSGNDKDGLGLYYAYTIYDQVFSRVIAIPLSPKRREEFSFEAPNVTRLGGYMVVCSHDLSLHEKAIDYLVGDQVSLAELPEAEATRVAYEEALSKTALVKKHIDRIRLVVAFSKGSRCDGCRQWVTTDG